MPAKLYNLPLKYNDTWRNFDSITYDMRVTGEIILGKSVLELEANTAQYVNSKFSVGVSNGTDALIITLEHLKQRFPGRTRVITTPLSYLASTSSIVLARLDPVFCDIDISLNLNPSLLANLIDDKTLAVLFVHYAGNPTNILDVANICKASGVPLIEDCAQSFGSSIDSLYSGAHGLAGCVSFHPLKLLSCLGDGGIIITSDFSLNAYARLARNHGHSTRDDIEFWSRNCRLDTLQASIVLSQMKWFTNELSVRRRQYLIYKSILGNRFLPYVHAAAAPSHNWMVILVSNRKDLIEFLAKHEVETKVHYPKLITELYPFSSNEVSQTTIRIAHVLKQQILSIPIGSHLLDSTIERIALLICSFYE